MSKPSEEKPDGATPLFSGSTSGYGTEQNDFLLLSPSDLVIAGNVNSDGDTESDEMMEDSDLSVFQPNPYIPAVDTVLPRIDRFYEFRECIGQGGFGDIHKAFDVVLQRDVAVKTLRRDNSKYSRRYVFITEAKVTAFLEHPNIIPIHGMYTDGDNQLHLVEKLIDGENLKVILRHLSEVYRNMTPQEIRREERHRLLAHLDIFLKVCDAISYAHNKKILHHDIKPENIMVGQFNEVYVTDWGLAESRDAKTQWKRKDVLGTLQYLSPEVIAKQSYDSRSDIYSLGVLLFNLVYLTLPFPATMKTGGVNELKSKGLTAPKKHLFDVKVPHGLNYIVNKAMAVQPAARYQTVQGLSDDLRRFLRGERIVETFFGRIRNFFSAVFRS